MERAGPVGGRELAAAAQEQGLAADLLQPADLAAQGRLRLAEVAGGGGEGAGAHHLHEGADQRPIRRLGA